MDIKELEDNVALMLNQLRLPYKKVSLIKNTSSQFVVEDFGLIVCCINRVDYANISDAVGDQFDGWRTTYITTNDNILEKKEEVLWDLMRCGYMKWLRYNEPRRATHVLTGTENLGTRIIRERLRIWNNQPKFRWLIIDNEAALRNDMRRELTNDPSFFDYMPEKGV